MDYLLELEKECRLRGFSVQTVKSYSFWVSKYLAFLEKSSLNLGNESVKSYLLSLNSSANTCRLAHASLSFFFRIIIKMPFTAEEVAAKKKPKHLPKVLSREEVLKMIGSTENLKHKLIIELLYSSGLRLQELINLKRRHIDTARNSVNVIEGKGGKDRITLLSERLKEDLLRYLTSFPLSSEYLFEGRNGKYSKKSVQKVIENAGKAIGKKVTPHMLRHSFATHLLENGTDIRYIRDLLGHSDIGTTLVYAKVSARNIRNIKSPLDN